MKRKHRVLIGKVGLDGHTTGLHVISKALADAGFEVIFAGIRLTPAHLFKSMLEEDVDLVGISILSGAHLTVARNLLAYMEKEESMKELPVVFGGIIPPEDVSKLKSMRVRDVFTSGTSMEEIVNRVRTLLETTREGDKP